MIDRRTAVLAAIGLPVGMLAGTLMIVYLSPRVVLIVLALTLVALAVCVHWLLDVRARIGRR